MKALYTAVVTANGGRNGHIQSDDGLLNLDVTMPEGLGGKGGHTNPEQLFAAGYASCFGSALDLVSRGQKITLTQNTVTAKVSIGQIENGGFGLAVILDVTVSGTDQATAESLVSKAHDVCPYSNATRGNIEVLLSVTAV